jgi:glutathione S-transferase
MADSTATQTQKTRLYELVMANGVSASPFVWRVRFALAHKGISFESVPLGFTEIPTALGGQLRTVPVLEDGQGRLGESWDIVEYLDRAYPERPALFASAAERTMIRFFDAWFAIEILRKLFRLYVLDIFNAARPQDRAYFRESREKRLEGLTLEACAAGRESQLPALREALAPLRWHLTQRPFIGGDSPSYADYIALGGFLWIASVSTLPPLARDDSLGPWLERGFDLFGALARDPRRKPLLE